VDSTDSVSTAFTMLREKNMYAVPVWDATKAQHVGFFGISDLVHFLVGLFAASASHAHPNHQGDEISLLAKTIFKASELDALHYKFINHPVGQLINVSQRNPWNPMSVDAPLQEVICTMVNENVSRLPLVDKNGKVVAIISESPILHFLSTHLDKLGDLANKTLHESIVASPIAVHSELNERTIVSFAKLVQHKMTHLTLNPSGTPHGTLSLKDIKAADEDFQWLVSPVGDFIAHIRQQNLKSVHPYMHLNNCDLFGHTIGRFEATGVHMMYLTSLLTELDKTASYPPIGLVTLHDLLAALVSNPAT